MNFKRYDNVIIALFMRRSMAQYKYSFCFKFKTLLHCIKLTFLSEPVVTCFGVGSGVISVVSVSVSSLSGSSLALLLTLLRPIAAPVTEDCCPAAAVVEADECGDD